MREQQRRALFTSRLRAFPMEVIRQPYQRERIDQPFGRIEIVPFRSFPIVVRIGMVIIVVALAEADERNQPAVPAAVLRAVRLSADHVAQGVDGEGGIQHQDGAQHAGE